MKYTEVQGLRKQASIDKRAASMRWLTKLFAKRPVGAKLDISRFINTAGKTPAPLDLHKNWLFDKITKGPTTLFSEDYGKNIMQEIANNHIYSKVRPQLSEYIHKNVPGLQGRFKNSKIFIESAVDQKYAIRDLMRAISEGADKQLASGKVKDGASAVQKAFEEYLNAHK